MGRKLVLRGVSIDPSAPVLPTIDVALPAAGTLLFIEPGHPYDPAVNVASGSYLPNLATEQARAATGISSAGGQAFMPRFVTLNGAAFERSAKGGIHVVPSRTVAGSAVMASYSSTERADTALAAWVDANKGHSFYAATWGRWTRAVGPLSVGGYGIGTIAGQNSLAQFFTRPSGAGEFAYPTDARRLGWFGENVGPTALAPYFLDGAFLSPAASQIVQLMRPIFFQRQAADPNSTPAAIVYDYVFEDLTLSGRTYAQAHAVYLAKYTRDLKTVGGRYYGDTAPTDPATIA